jgi:Leucine-rich repeat (LRR) protein
MNCNEISTKNNYAEAYEICKNEQWLQNFIQLAKADPKNSTFSGQELILARLKIINNFAKSLIFQEVANQLNFNHPSFLTNFFQVIKVSKACHLIQFFEAFSEDFFLARELQNSFHQSSLQDRYKSIVEFLEKLDSEYSPKTINLTNCKLYSLPNQVRYIHNVTHLNLSGNKMTFVDDCIFETFGQNLKVLNLSDNCIVTLSEKVNQLSHLELLDMSRNYLITIPKFTHQFTFIFNEHKYFSDQIPSNILLTQSDVRSKILYKFFQKENLLDHKLQTIEETVSENKVEVIDEPLLPISPKPMDKHPKDELVKPAPTLVQRLFAGIANLCFGVINFFMRMRSIFGTR